MWSDSMGLWGGEWWERNKGDGKDGKAIVGGGMMGGEWLGAEWCEVNDEEGNGGRELMGGRELGMGMIGMGKGNGEEEDGVKGGMAG